LESKSKRCYFIDFTKRNKAFSLGYPGKKSAFVSRNVIFDQINNLQEKPKTEDKMHGEISDSSADSQSKEFEFSDDDNKPGGSDELLRFRWRQEGSYSRVMEQPKLLRRSDSVSVLPIRYGWDEDQVSFELVTKAGDHSSYKEAIETNDSDKWVIVMEHEMESMEKNQIWDLVNLLKGSKAIGCR